MAAGDVTVVESQLEALSKLTGLLNDGEDVPEELWGQAGMKVGTKRKQIDKQITSLKKTLKTLTPKPAPAPAPKGRVGFADDSESESEEERAKEIQAVEKKDVSGKNRGKGRDQKEARAAFEGDFY